MKVTEASAMNMKELLDALSECEEEQRVINAIYIKAASMDENMRKSKAEEAVIRRHIAIKINR